MEFPERFSNLPAYAFPRLRALLDEVPAGCPVVKMTIGEPQHDFPRFVGPLLAANLEGFRNYPPNDGAESLLAAYAGWVKRRYDVEADPATRFLALNGTREGLFNGCIALCPEQKNGRRPKILVPNPFYQVYAVAALTAGADPVFVPAREDTGFMPDFAGMSPEVLNDVAIAYICSPSNPQGAIADRAYWEQLLDLAEQYDFRIFADECYSEIYRNDAPIGLMEVAEARGTDPERVNIFQSLSKRSNLPGLRSGFTMGGPKSIAEMKKLRSYAGAPLPLPLQRVAEQAWSDEAHVEENRALYQEKYRIADEIFASVPGYQGPEGGFFLWLNVGDGEAATVKLYQETGVMVLPGAYLSRPTAEGDPAQDYIRVAMVAPKEEMAAGLKKIRDCLM